MNAIEFETTIDKNGHIYLPETFQHAYGKITRLVVILPEEDVLRKKRRRPGSAKGILQVLSEDNGHLSECHEPAVGYTGFTMVYSG